MAPDSSSRVVDKQLAVPDTRENPAAPLNGSRNNSNVTNLNMKSEADRLKTFDNWPVPFMDKTLMAAAGFFYLNKSDTVQCAFCNKQIGRWEEGDDPFKDHKRWSPNCPYLRRQFVGNIPRGGTPAITPALDQRTTYDACSPYRMELRPNAVNENLPSSLAHLKEKPGVTEACGPVFPTKGSVTARMKSFDSWPKCIKQRPEALCEAGFFYTGRGDQIVCFYCGGGLKDWQENDDPWEEHAKWFPKCMFLILNKGKDFVERVARSRGTVVPAEAVRDLSVTNESSSVVPSGGVGVSAQPSSGKPSVACEQTSNEEKKTGETNDDHLMCKICYEEELGVVFLPCGHLVACVKCAPVLTSCAVCREPVKATVRASIP